MNKKEGLASSAKAEMAKIETVETLAGGNVLMKICAPHVARHAQPGHFVMVRTGTGLDPLLRRPLGILKKEGPAIWLYFQVCGKGTDRLASKPPGDALDLLGPLGRPFPQCSGRRILLLAGGRGIVPLFFFAAQTAATNTVTMIYGGKRSEEIHLLDDIAGLGLSRVIVRSEDGKIGTPGKVTDDLPRVLDDERIDITFSCGPKAMLDAVHGMTRNRGGEHYVSLEALMGCGFGACQSCAVPAASGGFLHACSEGPLFRMDEIQWPT